MYLPGRRLGRTGGGGFERHSSHRRLRGAGGTDRRQGSGTAARVDRQRFLAAPGQRPGTADAAWRRLYRPGRNRPPARFCHAFPDRRGFRHAGHDGHTAASAGAGWWAFPASADHEGLRGARHAPERDPLRLPPVSERRVPPCDDRLPAPGPCRSRTGGARDPRARTHRAFARGSRHGPRDGQDGLRAGPQSGNRRAAGGVRRCGGLARRCRLSPSFSGRRGAASCGSTPPERTRPCAGW